MNYPSLVYRCPGAHFGPSGQSYDYRSVGSSDELVAAVKGGWSVTLLDAVEAATDARHDEEDDDENADDGAVTRAELEQMAGDLGIKFDGRTTDAALLRKIESAIPEKS
jgi:hypothetical protein